MYIKKEYGWKALAWNLSHETLDFNSAIQLQHKFKFQTSNEMVKIDTL